MSSGLVAQFGSLCSEGVTRQGEFQPCDKEAVAVRIDPEERQPYAVCAFHARAEMLPLAALDAFAALSSPSAAGDLSNKEDQ